MPGPEGTAGTMEFNPQQSFDNAESALVYHYDHLGSIERITPHGSTSTTYVLDGQGKPSRYSYDAWGQRRNADTWSGAPTTTADGGSDDATPRGYTGHEMLDDLGLVHMNGRIYDPLLGRFLSADILVQNAGDLQAYNRYAYVRNNPVSLNDPSGHAWSAVITIGFAAFDTYQYLSGKTSGTEYAANMALNGAALVADVATLGQGGGLAVRAANIAIKTAKAIDRANDAYQTVQGVADAVEATGELASKVVEGNASLADVGNAALNVANAVVEVKSRSKGPDIPSDKMHVSRLEGTDINTKKLDGVDSRSPTSEANSPSGGAHRETSQPRRDNLDSHHTPADSVTPWSSADGPAIKMDPEDHKKTASWGSSEAAEDYRERQGKLVDEGKFEEALQMDIDDIRSKFGDKYNTAINQMKDYSKELFEKWRKEHGQ